MKLLEQGKINKFMEAFNKSNNSKETESISKNEENVFKAKNSSIILMVLFVLYAIIFAIIYFMYGTLVLSASVIDMSAVLIVISLYFRLAKKKLSDGNKVKKYDEQTRKMARTIIILVISFTILPVLLFTLGFN